MLGEKTEYHDTYPKSVKKSALTASDFFEIPTIPTASIVYRNGVRIPKLSHSHGDFLLYCALLSIGLAGFIDEKMSVYRLHEKGVSSKYNENWYLERRINELLVEAKYSQFSRKVSQEIEKTLVKIIIDYLNQNRGVLCFRQKIHYFRILIQLKKFFNSTSKDYIKLFKSLLS